MSKRLIINAFMSGLNLGMGLLNLATGFTGLAIVNLGVSLLCGLVTYALYKEIDNANNTTAQSNDSSGSR